MMDGYPESDSEGSTVSIEDLISPSVQLQSYLLIGKQLQNLRTTIHDLVHAEEMERLLEQRRQTTILAHEVLEETMKSKEAHSKAIKSSYRYYEQQHQQEQNQQRTQEQEDRFNTLRISQLLTAKETSEVGVQISSEDDEIRYSTTIFPKDAHIDTYSEMNILQEPIENKVADYVSSDNVQMSSPSNAARNSLQDITDNIPDEHREEPIFPPLTAPADSAAALLPQSNEEESHIDAASPSITHGLSSQDINKLLEDLDCWKLKCSHLDQELSMTKVDYDQRLRNTINDHEALSTKQQTLVEKLSHALRATLAENDQMAAYKQMVELETTHYDAALSSLQEDFLLVKDRVETFEKDCFLKDSQIAQISAELAEKTKQCSRYEAYIASIEQKYEELYQEHQSVQAHVDEVNRFRTALQVQVHNQQPIHERLERSNLDLEAQLTELRQQNAILSAKVEEQTGYIAGLQEEKKLIEETCAMKLLALESRHKEDKERLYRSEQLIRDLSKSLKQQMRQQDSDLALVDDVSVRLEGEKQTVAGLQGELVLRDQQVLLLRKSLEEAKQTVVSELRQREVLEQQVKTAASDAWALKEKLYSRDQETAQLRREREDATHEVGRLVALNKELLSRCEASGEELDSKTRETERLASEVIHLRSHNQRLEFQLRDRVTYFEREIGNTVSALGAAQREIDEHMQRSAALMASEARLQRERLEAKERIVQLEAEVLALWKQVDAKEEALRVVQVAQDHTTAEYREAVDRLEDRIRAHEGEVSTVSGLLEKASINCSDAQHRASLLEIELANSSKDCVAAKTQLEETLQQMYVLDECIRELTTQKDASEEHLRRDLLIARERIVTLEIDVSQASVVTNQNIAEINSLELANSQLRRDIEKLSVCAALCDRLQTERDAIVSALNANQVDPSNRLLEDTAVVSGPIVVHSINRLITELKGLHHDIGSMKQEHERLTEHYYTEHDMRTELESSLARLQHRHDEVAQTKAMLETTQAQALTALRGDTEDLAARLEEIRREQSQLLVERDALLVTNKSVASHVTDLQSRLTAVERESAEAKSELELARREKAQSLAELHRVSTVLAALEQENVRLHSDLTSAAVATEASTSAAEALRKQVLFLQDAIEDLAVKHSSEISRMRSTLQSSREVVALQESEISTLKSHCNKAAYDLETMTLSLREAQSAMVTYSARHQEAEEFSGKLIALEGAIQRAVEENDKLLEAGSEYARRLAKEKQKRDVLKTEVSRLQAAYASLRAETDVVSRAHDQCKQRENQLESTVSALKTTADSLLKEKSQLAQRAQAESSGLGRELQSVREQLQDETARHSQLLRDHSDLQQRFTEAAEHSGQVESSLEQYKAEVSQLQATLSKLRSEHTRASLERDASMSTCGSLKSQMTQLQTTITSLSSDALVLHQDRDRAVISASQAQFDMTESVNTASLLKEENRKLCRERDHAMNSLYASQNEQQALISELSAARASATTAFMDKECAMLSLSQAHAEIDQLNEQYAVVTSAHHRLEEENRALTSAYSTVRLVFQELQRSAHAHDVSIVQSHADFVRDLQQYKTDADGLFVELEFLRKASKLLKQENLALQEQVVSSTKSAEYFTAENQQLHAQSLALETRLQVALTELEVYRSEVTSLSEKNKQNDSLISTVVATKDELLLQVSTLSEELVSHQRLSDALIEDLASCKSTIQVIQESNDLLKSELEMSTREYQLAVARQESATAEAASLQERLDASVKENNSIYSTYNELYQSHMDLMATSAEQLSVQGRNEKLIKNLHAVIYKIEQDVGVREEQHRGEVDDLHAKLTQLRVKRRNEKQYAQESLQLREKELVGYRERIIGLETLTAQLQGYRDESKTLLTQVSSLQESSTKLEVVMTEKQSRLESLHGELVSRDTDIAAINQLNEQLKGSEAALRRDIIELTATIEASSAAASLMRVEKDRSVSSLHEEKTNLQQQLLLLQEEHKSTKEATQALSLKLIEREREISVLEQEKRTMQSSLSAAIERLQKTEEDRECVVTALEKEKQTLQNYALELQQNVQRSQGIESQFKQVVLDFTKLQSSKIQEVEALEKANYDLTLRLTKATSDIDEMRAKYVRAEGEVGKLRSNEASLSSALDRLKSELSRLSSEHTSLQHKYEVNELQYNNNRQRVDQLGQDKQHLESMLALKDQAIVKLVGEQGDITRREKELTETVRHHEHNLGLIREENTLLTVSQRTREEEFRQRESALRQLVSDYEQVLQETQYMHHQQLEQQQQREHQREQQFLSINHAKHLEHSAVSQHLLKMNTMFGTSFSTLEEGLLGLYQELASRSTAAASAAAAVSDDVQLRQLSEELGRVNIECLSMQRERGELILATNSLRQQLESQRLQVEKQDAALTKLRGKYVIAVNDRNNEHAEVERLRDELSKAQLMKVDRETVAVQTDVFKSNREKMYLVKQQNAVLKHELRDLHRFNHQTLVKLSDIESDHAALLRKLIGWGRPGPDEITHPQTSLASKHLTEQNSSVNDYIKILQRKTILSRWAVLTLRLLGNMKPYQ